MASKWDKDLAKDICSWIKRATGDSVPSDDPTDFAEALENGQILCNLANKIQPGAIKKINKMKSPFQKMENIGWFSDFVTAYGVQKEYGFVTVDLYEKQNVPQVLIALKWLKTEAEKKGVKL
ncbi:calponin [Desmophyllum pertusum]|uniref:Calponin n=1 Tax=Desmophyllum pertusum TaxID=174260 RepID=A0A9X0CM33_9CNID|nr:calponin [Desmophyllum pertusum]